MIQKSDNQLSTEHYNLLYNAAKSAISRYPMSLIDIDELVSIGWIRCIRTLGDKPYINHRYLNSHMVYFLRKEIRKFNHERNVKLECDSYDFYAIADEKLDAMTYLSILNEKEIRFLIDRFSGGSLRQLGRKYRLSPEGVRVRCNSLIGKIRKHFRIKKEQ